MKTRTVLNHCSSLPEPIKTSSPPHGCSQHHLSVVTLKRVSGPLSFTNYFRPIFREKCKGRSKSAYIRDQLIKFHHFTPILSKLRTKNIFPNLSSATRSWVKNRKFSDFFLGSCSSSGDSSYIFDRFWRAHEKSKNRLHEYQNPTENRGLRSRKNRDFRIPDGWNRFWTFVPDWNNLYIIW